MPEGLSADEVGKEIAGHAEHGGEDATHRRDRLVSILEAVLLSIVALLAAYSGYAAAQWSTKSDVSLAEATSLRTQANRHHTHASQQRNFDSSTFQAWFAAYTARNRNAMAIAEHGFRPEFQVAFKAWRATHPAENPNAPKGPTYMPQYRQPGEERSNRLDDESDHEFAVGEHAGEQSDEFIRVTVFLASVLFLVGISTRFPLRGGRYALVTLGIVLLVVSIVELTKLDGPP